MRSLVGFTAGGGATVLAVWAVWAVELAMWTLLLLRIVLACEGACAAALMEDDAALLEDGPAADVELLALALARVPVLMVEVSVLVMVLVDLL